MARFFFDLTDGLRLGIKELSANLRQGGAPLHRDAFRLAMLVWLAVMIILPLGQSLGEIVVPPFNAPIAMASYLNEHVPQEALIETWEPEMGFLTDHNYHFPPTQLLARAVSQAFLGGAPVAQSYHFVQTEHPAYVLVGEFARGTAIYPADLLAANYEQVTHIGGYELYQRKMMSRTR